MQPAKRPSAREIVLRFLHRLTDGRVAWTDPSDGSTWVFTLTVQRPEDPAQ